MLSLLLLVAVPGGLLSFSKSQAQPQVERTSEAVAASNLTTPDAPWRMSKTEFRFIFEKYERTLESDGEGLRELSPREKRLIPAHVLERRLQGLERAIQGNRKVYETIADSSLHSSKSLLDIMYLNGSSLGKQDYTQMRSILVHLYRDWSRDCEHLHNKIYFPVVEALKRHIPDPDSIEVLVPG